MNKTLNIPRADLLRAAIAGYQAEIKRINGVVNELRLELEGPEQIVRPVGPRKHAPMLVEKAWKAVAPKRHTLSSAARARISAAQKKRWREYSKAKGKAA